MKFLLVYKCTGLALLFKSSVVFYWHLLFSFLKSGLMCYSTMCIIIIYYRLKPYLLQSLVLILIECKQIQYFFSAHSAKSWKDI